MHSFQINLGGSSGPLALHCGAANNYTCSYEMSMCLVRRCPTHLAHVVRRCRLLDRFVPCRWRYWNRWLKPAEMASPTSLLSVHTIDNYTRLVLKNPKSDEPARGGSFVYISVPGALGTDEAHAMTVALRGTAPLAFQSSKQPVSAPQEEVFTLYVKDLGAWTKALRRAASNVADPRALLVDVDGFYSHTTSFNTMMKGGAPRVLIVAGGSGVTSLMGFVQVKKYCRRYMWCDVFVEQRNAL